MSFGGATFGSYSGATKRTLGRGGNLVGCQNTKLFFFDFYDYHRKRIRAKLDLFFFFLAFLTLYNHYTLVEVEGKAEKL